MVRFAVSRNELTIPKPVRDGFLSRSDLRRVAPRSGYQLSGNPLIRRWNSEQSSRRKSVIGFRHDSWTEALKSRRYRLSVARPFGPRDEKRSRVACHRILDSTKRSRDDTNIQVAFSRDFPTDDSATDTQKEALAVIPFFDELS